MQKRGERVDDKWKYFPNNRFCGEFDLCYATLGLSESATLEENSIQSRSSFKFNYINKL